MYTLEESKKLLAARRRQALGFYPTPLHKLGRLSGELGVNLYLKRDDMSGINLFGGNKIRKLEYLIGDAISKGCDTVFTFGATQSNHAMQTVTACRRCGLEPVLYLVSVVEPDPKDLKANLMLDYIYGAEVHIISIRDGESEADADARAYKMGVEHAERLERLGTEGKRPYIIPIGGASPIGTLGFIGGFIELAEQMPEPADYLFHATGSGGTLAGLAAGREMLNAATKIVAVSASPKDAGYEEHVCELAAQALALIDADTTVTPDSFAVDRNYFAPGYEMPNAMGNAAIRRLARTEGILTDTVYSGKAFAGMLDYIEKGLVPQGSNVVFLHTGGATALFAEREIVGDLAEN